MDRLPSSDNFDLLDEIEAAIEYEIANTGVDRGDPEAVMAAAEKVFPHGAEAMARIIGECPEILMLPIGPRETVADRIRKAIDGAP